MNGYLDNQLVLQLDKSGIEEEGKHLLSGNELNKVKSLQRKQRWRRDNFPCQMDTV